METSKLQLFTTFLSTLTRKSSAVFGLLILVSGATLFLSPQTALANTRLTNVSRVIHSNGDVDAVTVYCTIGKAYTEYLYNDTLSYETGIFGLPTPRHYCATGTIAFDGFNMDTLVDAYNGVDNWTSWIHMPMEWGVVDTTGEGGCSSEASCAQYNVTGAWQGYNNGIYIPYVEGYNDGYYVPTTIYYAGGGPSWTTTPYNRTWSNSADGDGSGNYTPPAIDSSTHIASTTPANLQNTATSTSYFFGVEGVINSADIGSNMNVTMQYYNDTLAQAVVSPSVVSHYITFPLTASTTQSFSFSTTTNMSTAPLGRYYLKTTINKDEFSFFGFSFWSTAIATQVTTFYVSTTTAHIYVTGYDAIADTSNPANITAIEAGIQTCDFSWGDLASTTKISLFLTCLVVPDSSSLAITFGQFQQNVLTLAPWGYITRFVSILASTTPVEPPPLTYKFGSSSPAVLRTITASDPITFQVFDYMGSSSPLLQIRADDGSNKNIWDIIDPFITFMVTIGVLLVVLADIMGFSMPSGESENERMKKIDYSKMSDKEFQKKVKIEYVTEEEQRMQRRNRL